MYICFGVCYMLTHAGSVVLLKARRAFASEATDGVNTHKLAVVPL